MKRSERGCGEREAGTTGSMIPQQAIFVPEESGLLVAEALGATQCIVSTSVDERIAEICVGHVASFGEIRSSAKAAIVEYCEARHRMFSVVTLRGRFARFVQVSGPKAGRSSPSTT